MHYRARSSQLLSGLLPEFSKAPPIGFCRSLELR
jgi:hypothetical protein